LRGASQLHDAARALDEFSLALALKCLRAPNLEKRLSGLSEIKELIAVSLRKHESAQTVPNPATVTHQPW
jgi:hypothetical protein